MALRAGMVALSTKLETDSQRLWFTSVNGSSRQAQDLQLAHFDYTQY